MKIATKLRKRYFHWSATGGFCYCKIRVCELANFSLTISFILGILIHKVVKVEDSGLCFTENTSIPLIVRED